MKTAIKQSILDKIDAYFEAKDKKEFYYTLVGIVGAIGFGIFYFVTPKADDFLNQNRNNFNTLTRNLNQNIAALNVAKAKKIRKERKLKILNKNLIASKKDKVFYSQLVNLLDFTSFNKYRWAEFVKTTIVDAKTQGLDVTFVKNIDVNNEKDNKKNKNKLMAKNISLPSSIVKKMGFGMNLKGGYKNFVYYMYKYENIKPLIRVDSFEIDYPNKYYIEFSLYGSKL